jgi:hypothetical protein
VVTAGVNGIACSPFDSFLNRRQVSTANVWDRSRSVTSPRGLPVILSAVFRSPSWKLTGVKSCAAWLRAGRRWYSSMTPGLRGSFIVASASVGFSSGSRRMALLTIFCPVVPKPTMGSVSVNGGQLFAQSQISSLAMPIEPGTATSVRGMAKSLMAKSWEGTTKLKFKSSKKLKISSSNQVALSTRSVLLALIPQLPNHYAGVRSRARAGLHTWIPLPDTWR